MRKVALVSVPSVVLLDKNNQPFSPVRTNYFPHAQLLLGTMLRKYSREHGLGVDVRFSDFKSLSKPERWKDNLEEYGEVQYGKQKLTKCFIGNGLERISSLAGIDIIGITANFTMEANSVVSVIQEIRKINPNAVIIVGGRDASARPEFYKKHGATTVVIGDADIVLPELVESIIQGRKTVPDLLVGDQKKLPRRAMALEFPIEMFSSLFFGDFIYHESGSGTYFLPALPEPLMPMYFETSRGCSRTCNFCTESATFRIDYPINELMQIAKYYHDKLGFNVFMISDDNILQRLRKPRGEEELIAFFNYLRKLGVVWEFPAGIEFGMLMKNGQLRNELMDAMFGCGYAHTGPAHLHEHTFSGALRTLVPFENLGGGEQLQKIIEWKNELLIVRRLIELGVPQLNLGVMIGAPTDSNENIRLIKERLRILEELQTEVNAVSQTQTAFNHSIFCTMPLPGTRFFKNMIGAGRITYDIEKDPELWNVFISVIKGKFFSPEKVTNLRKEIISEFGSSQPDGKVNVPFSGKGLPVISLERGLDDEE